MTPNQKGAIAEAAIALHAMRAGIFVLRPVMEGSRYDLVFDTSGRLLRVQCKWAPRSGDAVNVRARTCRRARGGAYVRGVYSAEEVDVIAAYCPELDRSYLIPISVFSPGGHAFLRLTPSRNNQRSGIHWASDYELGAIAQLGERLHGMQEVAGSSPASSTPPTAISTPPSRRRASR
jgi:hypothetical protein